MPLFPIDDRPTHNPTPRPVHTQLVNKGEAVNALADIVVFDAGGLAASAGTIIEGQPPVPFGDFAKP